MPLVSDSNPALRTDHPAVVTGVPGTPAVNSTDGGVQAESGLHTDPIHDSAKSSNGDSAAGIHDSTRSAADTSLNESTASTNDQTGNPPSGPVV